MHGGCLLAQDTASPLSSADPRALGCYFCFIWFVLNGSGAVSSSCWAPSPCSGAWPWHRGAAQPCPCQPHMAVLVSPFALKNELLLMDFWLAFPRHLAHSWASCHGSNGAACDPDKGLLCWGLSCPFLLHLGYEECAYVFLKYLIHNSSLGTMVYGCA